MIGDITAAVAFLVELKITQQVVAHCLSLVFTDGRLLVKYLHGC